MEKVKKILAVQRSSFDQVFDAVLDLFRRTDPDEVDIFSKINLLEQKIDILMDLHKQFVDFLLDDDDALILEISTADEYSTKYYRIKLMADDEKRKPFVWNRVKKTRSVANKNGCYKIDGNLNPAKPPFLGCSSKEQIDLAEKCATKVTHTESFNRLDDTQLKCLCSLIEDGVRMSNLNKYYDCNFEALDHCIKCSNVACVRKGPWIDKLQSVGIEITDSQDGPIDILIGADIAGKLFTGNRYELECGLVALETRLGWTLMGKLEGSSYENAKSSMVMSMFSNNESISDLWSLDVLGISDPAEKGTRKETEEFVMAQFMNSITRNNDGRYEVCMSWIEDHPPLPSNYGIAKKRLESLRWWERLIGIIKDILRKVLGKASLSYEELSTTLCDCESIMNSRPLTYSHEDSRDLVPLTPAMFLREIPECGVPDLDAVESSDLRKHLRYRMKLKEDLRRRFRSEYLGQLKSSAKYHFQKEINVGDIVLIGSDNLKRLDWPLAYIEEFIPGRDNKIRLVRLKTAKGTILRPLQRVYPLELNCSSELDLSSLTRKVPSHSEGTENKQKDHNEENSGRSESDPITTRCGRTVKPIHRLGM